ETLARYTASTASRLRHHAGKNGRAVRSAPGLPRGVKLHRHHLPIEHPPSAIGKTPSPVLLTHRLSRAFPLCIGISSDDLYPLAPLVALASYCNYAVIYRRSPVGLPLSYALKQTKNPAWDEKLDRLLQQLA